MGRMPELLGAMLVRTTFIVGMLAFIALIYVRGLVLVSKPVIGFPILIVVITMTLCVFILLPLAIFRKARIVPAIGFLLRYTYSLSRRIRFPDHTENWHGSQRDITVATAHYYHVSIPNLPPKSLLLAALNVTCRNAAIW